MLLPFGRPLDPFTRSRPISDEGLPLKAGDEGERVDDLRRRLGRAGFITTGDPRGCFGPETTSQVTAFQASRGLHPDGVCGLQTWAALLEADHSFGDRTLYLRQPMLRGDDVAELQRRLGSLGFDAGRIDAIFGRDSAGAVAEFQANVGLTVDGVCGRDTFDELRRIGERPGLPSVATVRERERLLRPDPSAAPARVLVGDFGEHATLADEVARVLAVDGVDVAVVHHPDPSSQASAANDHGAAAYLGLVETDVPTCTLSYFSTDGYTSSGGRHLAHLLASRLPAEGYPCAEPTGMRLPVLRETRMPAVVCRIPPSASPVGEGDAIAAALACAVRAWLDRPIDP